MDVENVAATYGLRQLLERSSTQQTTGKTLDWEVRFYVL